MKKKSNKKIIQECDEHLAKIKSWQEDTFRDCDLSHMKNYWEQLRAETASKIGRDK